MKWRTYPAYRDSGVEWLGEIPEHWEILKIRRITKHHKQGYYTEEPYVDEGVKLIRITDIDDFGNTSFEHMPFVSISERDETAFKANHGDFVFARSGTVGRFGLVLNPDRSVFASYLIRFIFGMSTPEYVKCFFLSKYFKESLISTLHGGANQNVHAENIKNQWICTPNPNEQQAIAAFLDRETSRIDELIAKKQRQIELLQEKRSALISHAVTKGLDPDVKMKDSGVEWLGEIPESWEIRRLRYLGYCQNGINIGAEKFGTGYPFVSYGDVYNNSALPVVGSGLVESSDADRTRYSVETGDVFFTRTSETIEEIGFSSVCFKTILDAVFAGFLIRFRPVGKTLNIGFSELYFRSDHLRAFFVKEMNLVTRASLSQDLLKEMPVLLPPIDEQRAIAAFLDRETARIDSMVNKVTESIDLLREYRTALISAAVTGKIDVREEVA